jgi:hypothetical protein
MWNKRAAFRRFHIARRQRQAYFLWTGESFCLEKIGVLRQLGRPLA